MYLLVTRLHIYDLNYSFKEDQPKLIVLSCFIGDCEAVSPMMQSILIGCHRVDYHAALLHWQ